MYAITATALVSFPTGGTTTRQVPTFYLNADVQGIVNEAHAERIARGLLRTVLTDDQMSGVALSVTAVEL